MLALFHITVSSAAVPVIVPISFGIITFIIHHHYSIFAQGKIANIIIIINYYLYQLIHSLDKDCLTWSGTIPEA